MHRFAQQEQGCSSRNSPGSEPGDSAQPRVGVASVGQENLQGPLLAPWNHRLN